MRAAAGILAAACLGSALPAQVVIDQIGHGLQIIDNNGTATLEVDTMVIMDAGRDLTVGGDLNVQHGSFVPPYGTAAPIAADCSAAALARIYQEMRPGFYALWVCAEATAATFTWQKVQLGNQEPDPPALTYPAPFSEWLFAGDEDPGQVIPDTGAAGVPCTLGASSAPDGADPVVSPYGLEFAGLATEAQFVDCAPAEAYKFLHQTQNYTLAVMARADSVSGTDGLIGMSYWGIPHDGYRFVLQPGPILAYRANGAGDLIVKTTAQPLGGWRHYALVYEAANPPSGATVRFYLNGQLVTSTTQTATLGGQALTDAPFRIGSIEQANGFHGGISGAWVWDQALSGAEVNGHCEAGEAMMVDLGAPGVQGCQ